TVTLASLLANDSDPEGDVPLTITAVSGTSTNGASVSLGATDVTYTPVAGYTGPDLFTYTVTDSLGASSTGNVYVFVTDGPVPASNNIAITSSAGSRKLTFRGTPGTTYRILRSTFVTGPWDTVISTQTAPPSGIIAVTDSSPPPNQAFYKVVTP
ncbi:MAG TPA: cadherin-like domain-containing protein, partial [Verrucomicrobiae bacterium]